MNYISAKDKFIEEWGILGSSWGINKAMAQIHALLLISPESLTANEIMDELKMSRGNVNMNTRALIDWGIVYKELRPGDRKEYFKTDKDIWKLAVKIIQERRKRELLPLYNMLEQVKNVPLDESIEVNEFIKVTSDIENFTQQADKLLNKVVKSDKSWFMKLILKLIK